MRTHRAQLGGERGASRRSSTARALHLLMANLDVTDAELADLLRTSRQTINSRRKGRVPMTADDLSEVAEALGVDVAILLGPPHEAVRWLVEHQPDRLDALESPGVRHGELSNRSDRQGCTAPTLTLLTYRSILMGERTGLAA